MEIDDEDVVACGTDLQKYLLAVGCSEFEVSESKNVKKLRSPAKWKTKFKCERKIDQPNQNDLKNIDLCINLIKIIVESQLMFKEDTLFIKEFIPSNHHYGYLSVFTKQNSMIVLTLFICIFLNVFFPKYCNKWIAICIMTVWFGYLIIKILYESNLNRTIKKTVLTTLSSMNKCSLLVQKTTHFIQECNSLHGVYCCGLSHHGTCKSSDSFKYLLMPELKTLFLNVLSELIDGLVYNIFDVHKFFPLKDSVANMVYLYLTDCKIDTQNTSLENINKAKYMYFLLQSEFLKLTALCFCPVLWMPGSCLQMSRLIKTVGEFEKVYSDSYNALYEEYNLYSLFKNNNIEQSTPVSNNVDNAVSDLKSKVSSVRHFLHNMMVHVRFMEDSIENSSESCASDLTDTLNVLVKEVGVFSEFISNLQICILKTSNDNQTVRDSVITNEHCDGENNGCAATEVNDTANSVCEDELFVGVSEELRAETADCKIVDEEMFDKSNNRDLLLELKVALENKQVEWKIREEKLLEKHPHLTADSSEWEESNEILREDENRRNTVRKVALDLPLVDGRQIMQLPNTNLASEIAMIACKWNTDIHSFGDDSDTDGSMNSTDS